jgi:hypothetical protein
VPFIEEAWHILKAKCKWPYLNDKTDKFEEQVISFITQVSMAHDREALA